LLTKVARALVPAGSRLVSTLAFAVETMLKTMETRLSTDWAAKALVFNGTCGDSRVSTAANKRGYRHVSLVFSRPFFQYIAPRARTHAGSRMSYFFRRAAAAADVEAVVALNPIARNCSAA